MGNKVGNKNKKRDVKERFEEKFIKNENGCWEWIKYKNNWGYGKFSYNGKYETASRVSWIIYRGEIPEGLFICHKCDNPGCVNPDHLFLGTPKDNMDDAVEKGRIEFTGDKNKNSKLTEKKVRLIKYLYNVKKFNQCELGRIFNVTNSIIHLIVNNKSWKHVK